MREAGTKLQRHCEQCRKPAEKVPDFSQEAALAWTRAQRGTRGASTARLCWRSTLPLNTRYTEAGWDEGIMLLKVGGKNGWISTACMEYLLFAANML